MLYLAGELGVSFCGLLGRHYGFISGANIARWLALLGVMIGTAMFILFSYTIVVCFNPFF